MKNLKKYGRGLTVVLSEVEAIRLVGIVPPSVNPDLGFASSSLLVKRCGNMNARSGTRYEREVYYCKPIVSDCPTLDATSYVGRNCFIKVSISGAVKDAKGRVNFDCYTNESTIHDCSA